MVTIRDVAKESGFSSTYGDDRSQQCTPARYIPDVTKKRIERAAQEASGYRPNQFARFPCAASAAAPSASWSST